MFGVCVNFKISVFQWSALQICAEMALENRGVKDSAITAGGSSMSIAGPLSYQLTQAGPPA